MPTSDSAVTPPILAFFARPRHAEIDPNSAVPSISAEAPIFGISIAALSLREEAPLKDQSRSDPGGGRPQGTERPAPDTAVSSKKELPPPVTSTRKQLPKPSPR
jgi:hypothetical protein